MRRLIPFLLQMSLVACGTPGAREAGGPPRTVRFLAPSIYSEFSGEFIERMQAAEPPLAVESLRSSGSLVVLSMLQGGRGDIGFSLADVAYLAYRKGLDAAPFPHTNVRSVAVRWMSTMYALVPRSSSYRRFTDLRGRRIGTVPLGSADEVLTKMLLDAHGIPASEVTLFPMSLDRLPEQIRDGALDAAMFPGTPLNDMRRLIEEFGLRVVELDTGVVRTLQEQYPFIKSVSVDTGLVDTHGPLTVGVDSALLCRADLDEQLVYQVTSAFYGLLVNTARTRAGVDPNNAAAVPIPLHPGAARFYREQQVLNGL